MIKDKKQKGFTMIELLVAIALIGILFFVSYGAIDQMREKGYDETVYSYFATAKAQAERYYSKYNKFSKAFNHSVCYDEELGFNGLSSGGLLDKLKDVSGAGKINLGNEIHGDWDTVTCHARSIEGVDSWVIEVPTKNSTEDNPEMYCIDSSLPSFIIKNNVLLDSPNTSSIVGFYCIDSYTP